VTQSDRGDHDAGCYQVNQPLPDVMPEVRVGKVGGNRYDEPFEPPGQYRERDQRQSVPRVGRRGDQQRGAVQPAAGDGDRLTSVPADRQEREADGEEPGDQLTGLRSQHQRENR
jgi:hypothetical protein